MNSEFLDWVSALGDATRLRMLHLLEREELGVGELARVVQLPQSTVSRHLKALLERRWIVKRPLGTASMYRFTPELLDDDASQLWAIARRRTGEQKTFVDDLARLEEVLRERMVDSRSFFGRIGGEWDALRRELFGDVFTAEALLSLLDPSWVVADVGCGTGNVAQLLAPYVDHVIAIDRERSMLDAARKRLASFANITFCQGDLSSLPLEDASVDVIIVSLVMHHVENPAAAVEEMARSLRASGRVLIVDMVAHDRETYRHTMGHRHLGFDERMIARWAGNANLRVVRHHRLRPSTESKGPGLFAAVLQRAGT